MPLLALAVAQLSCEHGWLRAKDFVRVEAGNTPTWFTKLMLRYFLGEPPDGGGSTVSVAPASRRSLVAAAQEGGTVVLPATAHLAGVQGTNWRSDVELLNLDAEAVTVSVDLLEHGKDNGAPTRVEVTVPPLGCVRMNDVLDERFAFSGKAALRLMPSGGSILVTSRTYNLLGGGNPLGLPAGATVGQFIPAFAEADAIAAGEEGRLIQLAHDPSGTTGSRTNLVLVNAAASSLSAQVDLFGADGVQLGTVPVTLAPFEYRQIDRVFERVTGSNVEHGYAVVSTATAGGRFFALASVVDNLTGDPVAMTAALVALAGEASGAGVVIELSGVMSLLRNAAAGGATLETVASRLIDDGLESTLDAMVQDNTGLLTRIPTGVTANYGSGTEIAEGHVLSGIHSLTVGSFSTAGGHLTASLYEDISDLEIDGKPLSLIDGVTWALDLQVAGDGSVVGDLSLTTEHAVASWLASMLDLPSIEGSVHIDTTVCLEYPVSGSFTVRLAGRTVEIVLAEDCTGAFSAASDSEVDFGVRQELQDVYEPHLWWTTASTGSISGSGSISQTTRDWGGLNSNVLIRGDNRTSPIIISAAIDGWPEAMVHRIDRDDGTYEVWTYTRTGIAVGGPPVVPGTDYTLVIPAGASSWPSVTVGVAYRGVHEYYAANGTLTGSRSGNVAAGRITYTFEQAVGTGVGR